MTSVVEILLDFFFFFDRKFPLVYKSRSYTISYNLRYMSSYPIAIKDEYIYFRQYP